jgi:septal ring factor EnvC (AmiA/AmiB activator)
MTRTPTRKLATARLEFSGDRRIVTMLHLTAATALIILVIAIGRQLYADMHAPDSLAGLRQQNAALRADLARVKTELELERSTRAALTAQVAQLNVEASELKSRLDFFNAQSGRSGGAR